MKVLSFKIKKFCFVLFVLIDTSTSLVRVLNLSRAQDHLNFIMQNSLLSSLVHFLCGIVLYFPSSKVDTGLLNLYGCT